MPELPELTEVVEEVHQPELQQHTRDLLTAWVLGLDNVYVEVPYQYGVLVPEACQGLLIVL